MVDVHIRLLTSKDIIREQEQMISIMKIILSDNITQNYPKDLALNYINKIPGYIEDGSAIVVGAFCDNHLVGFSWAYELSIFDERRLHIDMIGVDPKYRKSGIAHDMVALQIDEAKKRGVLIIEALTTKANTNSYSWFHSLGFVDERVKVKLELE